MSSKHYPDEKVIKSQSQTHIQLEESVNKKSSIEHMNPKIQSSRLSYVFYRKQKRPDSALPA